MQETRTYPARPAAHAMPVRAGMSVPQRAARQLIIVLFLLTQVLDGLLTYVGVSTFGITAEGNPLLAWLMSSVGEVEALAIAKLVASGCGIALYVLAVDRVIVVLTILYMAAAIVPWTLVLL